MNDNHKTYRSGDIPEFVIKTSSLRCCEALISCGAVENNEKIELCPDLSGLIPLTGAVTRDKGSALSGAYSLGSVLVKVCEAAALCEEWLVPDRFLDISAEGLFFDPCGGKVRIMPGACEAGIPFAKRICDLAQELAVRLPWLESEHLVRRLGESGASQSDDKKALVSHISSILMRSR